MRRQVLISVVLIISMLTLSACGDNASTNVEEVSLDSATAEAVVDTAKDVTEKTEEEVKETAKSEDGSEASENAEVVEAVANGSTTAEADGVEAIPVSTSTFKTNGSTGPNGWPVISGYTGTGNGPGLAWRDDYDYTNDDNWSDDTSEIGAYTASNGVTIKVLVIPFANGSGNTYWPLSDGVGKDLEPNSPWMKAVTEALATTYPDEDLSDNVNATLPATSYKRTSIDPNDASVKAYKEAYNYKRSTMTGGTYYGRAAGINDSIFFFTDGVGEYDKKGIALWEFRYAGSYWSLTIYQNPAEYQWGGIKNVLGYIDPNGASLYSLIYRDFYEGAVDVIPEYDEWYNYGSNQVMVPENSSYALWYFK